MYLRAVVAEQGTDPHGIGTLFQSSLYGFPVICFQRFGYDGRYQCFTYIGSNACDEYGRMHGSFFCEKWLLILNQGLVALSVIHYSPLTKKENKVVP